MIEFNERPSQIPFTDQLIERIKKQDQVQVSLNNEELHSIFSAQAESDESGDMPVLLSGFIFEIKDGELSFCAPYTIDADKKLVIYQGKAKNNQDGELIESAPMTVEPDSLRKRTEDAFEGNLNLPNFIKLITEDALKGRASVEKMFIDGQKLGMVFKKNV